MAEISGESITNLFGINSQLFKNIYKNLDALFELHNIKRSENFKNWRNLFIKIYKEKDCDKDLFLTHTYLSLLIRLILYKIFLNKNQFNFEDLNLNLTTLSQSLKGLSDFEQNFGKWIFLIPKNNTRESYNSLNQLILNFNLIFNSILKTEVIKEDLFHKIYQDMISASLRHSIGEFYTPSYIAEKMISESYVFGEKVLDPACGSGTFLIELIKRIISDKTTIKNKIYAINNIYGYDINPFAVFISKINVFILIEGKIPNYKINIEVKNSLFPDNEQFPNNFDLIIGNPPWLTYSSLDSLEYQNNLKNLVNFLKIKPDPKNILNLDLSTVFFYQCANLYLKNRGKIFFVITSGIITGTHNDRVRTFQGFKNIKIWTFTKEIFNVDFICLYATKEISENNKKKEQLEHWEIPIEHFDFKKTNFAIQLVKKKEDIYVPYAVVEKGEKLYVKKLIAMKNKVQMFPFAKSYYFDLFHKGADLNPRNLIFVSPKNKSDTLFTINVDKKILEKAKPPWNRIEYHNQIIEKKYIFKCVKSTELVKFNVFNSYNVFLPIEKNNLEWNQDSLSKYALSFYKLINEKYLKYKKNTTKHKSLMDNLNRWGKLINKRQLSTIKVVYNNSGSTLNAAVITGEYLITGDLSFFDTTNINEAYYLVAILNSPKISEQIKIRKSSRHIFKKALEFPIEQFNENKELHKNLSEIGRVATLKSKELCNKLTSKIREDITKNAIQKQISIRLGSIFKKLDTLIGKLFN